MTAPPLNAQMLAKALAVLRMFVGLISFSNGLAKLFSFSNIDIGWYHVSLIDRAEAKQILDMEVNKTEVPGLKPVVNDVILAHYGIFDVLLTATELGVGALLLIGLFSRGAALLGFGLHFFLQLVYFSSGRFAFEQPHEWVPPLILAIVSSGLVWGLDGRLGRNADGAKWPS